MDEIGPGTTVVSVSAVQSSDGRLIDLDALAERLTEGRPHPVPIFAYGSLIWNPGFAVGGIRRATAPGWCLISGPTAATPRRCSSTAPVAG